MMLAEKVFNDALTPADIKALWSRMEKQNGALAGKLRPWAWFGEITRGCNLRCGFCATRTFKGGVGAPKFGDHEFLTEKTWRELLGVMAVVSPRTRLEIGNAGEPSLNPFLVDMLRLKKEIAPGVQVLMYTNGTTLMDGRHTYKELFDAGLNVLYVNLYHPFKKHVALADKTPYPWLFEGKEGGAGGQFVSPFQYRMDTDPDFHLINFCRNPGYWTEQRRHRHGFSSFYNHLDWNAAAKYGLTPVTEPLKRRCDFPLKYPSFEYTGRYMLCCWDFVGETAGSFGSVADGVEGFFKFWFGEYMQRTRQLHDAKDRAGHPVCARCGTQSHRGDIPYWKPAMFERFWDGTTWRMPAPDAVDKAFAANLEAKPLKLEWRSVTNPVKKDLFTAEATTTGHCEADELPFDDGCKQPDMDGVEAFDREHVSSRQPFLLGEE